MTDYIIRATAAEGQIRCICSNDQRFGGVRQKCSQHKPGGNCGSGTSFDSRGYDGNYDEGREGSSYLKIEGDGPIGGLTVTADSRGNVKGYAFHPEVMLPPNAKGKLDVGGALE